MNNTNCTFKADNVTLALTTEVGIYNKLSVQMRILGLKRLSVASLSPVVSECQNQNPGL